MSAPNPSNVTSRVGWSSATDWAITVGLMAVLAWTTLCLGGFRPETMIVTSNGIFALAALGGLALVIRPRSFHPALLIPVPFLLYALASTFWLAPAPWLAWREWLLWLQMGIVFWLTLHFVRSRAQRATLAGALLGLGVAGSAMAIYQRFSDPHWLMLGREQADQFIGRSSGMFGIPNSLAALLELLIPACLVMLWSRTASLVLRAAAGAGAALFLFALILTGSRGGWISLTLALALWPLLGRGHWWKKVTGVVAVGVLAVVAFAALYRFSAEARGRMQPFLDGQFESSRPIIWRVGLHIWREHPWLGAGAGSYNVLFDQYRPRGFLNEPQWAHNDYLNTLSDYGVVGFALWFGAGACLLGLGWRAVNRARRPDGARSSESSWKLGLWLGCVSFALHLGVDFHTKMPALAFAFAVAMALLLHARARSAADQPAGAVVRLQLAAVLLGVLVIGVGRGWPLYRAEALRYDWRQRIDRAAAGRARLEDVVLPARDAFARATDIDPDNGRAWADLAYATVLSWHVEHGSTRALGSVAAPAADHAIGLCPLVAEFWVRKGVALDMQARSGAAGDCFTRALALAPNNSEWHFYHAYHLSTIPGRTDEALAALGTCLALDPGNSQAIALRARLQSSR